jgi:undecaprenyl-phosphate 4-deoxy-4-formamido-L-arabinose transferase
MATSVPAATLVDTSRSPNVPAVRRVTIVVPVYQGERTLEALIDEIAPLTSEQQTPRGQAFRVTDVILVNDGAIDDSTSVMKAIASQHPFVTLLWLSRNFGQHPATLAGMASSTGDWVVTLDEDGQFNPMDIGAMVDTAEEDGVQLVYARPLNPPPHGWLRNLGSFAVKNMGRFLAGSNEIGRFSSFRLIRGEIARSLAAYCGHGVYLDVALSWVVGKNSLHSVMFRAERGRASGYNLRRLVAHFWRFILTAGTRPLRIIAILGSLSILAALGISAYAIWLKLAHAVPIQGWTSLVTVVSFFSGIILFSLGVVAEYLAMTLTMAMGKPLYLIVSGPDSNKTPRR